MKFSANGFASEGSRDGFVSVRTEFSTRSSPGSDAFVGTVMFMNAEQARALAYDLRWALVMGPACGYFRRCREYLTYSFGDFESIFGVYLGPSWNVCAGEGPAAVTLGFDMSADDARELADQLDQAADVADGVSVVLEVAA